MLKAFLIAVAVLFASVAAQAQTTPVQDTLQAHSASIIKSSRKTIEPVIQAISNSGLDQVQDVLQYWQSKDIWVRKADDFFFLGAVQDDGALRLNDLDTGTVVGDYPKSEFKQIKPNSGVRALIGIALVSFQLLDPDPVKRQEALVSLERDPNAAALGPLRLSIDDETDPELKDKKIRLERLLTISYDPDEATRVSAIADMSNDIGLDVRATLSPLVITDLRAFEGEIPANLNIAQQLVPGSDAFTVDVAYEFLVKASLAPAIVSDSDIHTALGNNIVQGRVGGIPTAGLDDQTNRLKAYSELVKQGLVPSIQTAQQISETLAGFRFAEIYADPSVAVTAAARQALDDINFRVGLSQAIDLGLDALSLASIYFLAAIGLAITFGVMGVINMAHGEFIMMGAYTGYVVQQIVPNQTLSIILAIPAAFIVTFAAGVAMERLVIRWLYNRPLETLLATFGFSIALQQLAKNIFGTQARPLTSPAWLDGAMVVNDVISISYIRIAIFILAFIFLALFLFVMRHTRLGLETRAVTQNPRMAASMGINPNRVNMLAFGLGSGIAGIAGVAIGLFAKVTSEMGGDYIVQSFMTVVVGGVGNIWGTLAGAAMIGFLQKGIEWMNPSNTLAAQTYMIIFIIIFIQFRPRGIVALKGRAAED